MNIIIKSETTRKWSCCENVKKIAARVPECVLKKLLSILNQIHVHTLSTDPSVTPIALYARAEEKYIH